MSRLFDMSYEYEELFNLFDEIDELEPNVNENGEPIDNDGNVIEDIDAWHESVKEQWLNELIAKEDEFDNKAENVAQYIKNLVAESEAIAAEVKKLNARKKSKDNKIERLKNYLKDCMNQTGRSKIETAKVVLSIRNNAESVKIADEKAFINSMADSRPEFFRLKPEISKTEIKKALQNGEQINGAVLERSQSVIIK